MRLKRTDIYGGVKISSSDLIPGNIFFDGINKSLEISFENKRNNSLNMDVKYSVFDGSGNLYTEKNKTVSVDSGDTVSDVVNLLTGGLLRMVMISFGYLFQFVNLAYIGSIAISFLILHIFL